MKYYFVVLVSTLFCTLQSCNQAGIPETAEQAILKTDTCQQDPNHSYEVYIPERKSAAEKLPLLIILDSHGGGKFALDKFKSGADEYPVILVASNRVKNGLANYAVVIQTLVEDVRQKYPVNQTVFITGFSGGARMALGYSLAHPVNGVIMCGALAGAEQLKALNCEVISISGTDDFNFMETAQYLFQEQAIPGNLKIELTNASHSWPDSSMLADALGFLYLSSGSTSEKSNVKAYNQHQYERIETLKEQDDALKAALIARNLSTTEPFSNDKTFTTAYNDLKSDAGYTNELKKLEKCLKFELSVRQPYLEALTTKDSLWWKNEIRSIDNKLNAEQDSFNVDMYRRIKAFWGIACYSLGNQAIAKKQSAELENILSVYRTLEPGNSDMFYFSAFPPFWKGDQTATVAALKKAQEEGFSDAGRLKNDFPESITSQLNN